MLGNNTSGTDINEDQIRTSTQTFMAEWADSIKHDLHSAGFDTTNAAQMVFDRPQ